jgi:hypothetical protein
MNRGTVLALALLVVALGLTEIALWSHMTGRSITHIASLGAIPDSNGPPVPAQTLRKPK